MTIYLNVKCFIVTMLTVHTELISWKKNPSLEAGSSFLLNMYLQVPRILKSFFNCNTFSFVNFVPDISKI